MYVLRELNIYFSFAFVIYNIVYLDVYKRNPNPPVPPSRSLPSGYRYILLCLAYFHPIDVSPNIHFIGIPCLNGITEYNYIGTTEIFCDILYTIQYIPIFIMNMPAAQRGEF